MGEFEEKLNAILSNPEAMAQVASLAQSLGGGQPQQTPQTAAQERQDPQVSPHQEPEKLSGFGDLSTLLGQIDPSIIARLLPLVQEMNRPEDSQRKQFLYALRPYLKESRRDKVDRALQIARMLHLGKKFLGTLGDGNV